MFGRIILVFANHQVHHVSCFALFLPCASRQTWHNSFSFSSKKVRYPHPLVFSWQSPWCLSAVTPNSYVQDAFSLNVTWQTYSQRGRLWRTFPTRAAARHQVRKRKTRTEPRLCTWSSTTNERLSIAGHYRSVRLGPGEENACQIAIPHLDAQMALHTRPNPSHPPTAHRKWVMRLRLRSAGSRGLNRTAFCHANTGGDNRNRMTPHEYQMAPCFLTWHTSHFLELITSG